MSLQLDVFTLVPHAFGWLTERRPLAAVLGKSVKREGFGTLHVGGVAGQEHQRWRCARAKPVCDTAFVEIEVLKLGSHGTAS